MFVKKMILLNPSLDPVFTGGGFTPWMTRQGLVKAYTRGVTDAYILAQQLDEDLALVESLLMSARVRLDVIGTSRPRHLHLHRVAPLLRGRAPFICHFRAPPPHLEAREAQHRGAGVDLIPSPRHDTSL